MQKKLLTKLIKSNLSEKKTVDELIDEFVNTQTGFAKEQLEEFLSSLFVYINKNYDELSHDVLLSIVGSKLTDLNISFDTKELDDIYKRVSIINSPSTKFEFDKTDLKAIEAMRKGFYWTTEKYNKQTQDLLKNTIEEVFKGELSRADVSSILKDKFEGIITKDEAYYRLVADNMISQAQSISRVNQGLKYGVEYYKADARIDSQTSDFCRWVNGRIVSAKHLKRQINNILDAKTIDEKKDAAPWQSKPIFGKLPENVGLAPYHGHCRTENIPVWINEDERVDSKTGKKYKVKNTKEYKDSKLTHIDKTGIEVKVKHKEYDKIVNIKHNLTEKQLVGALNDIKYKAPHAITGLHPNEHTRSVLLTNNNYVLVYENNELITCFPPSRKASKYFNDNAVINKVTDVDTGEVLERVKKWYEHLI